MGHLHTSLNNARAVGSRQAKASDAPSYQPAAGQMRQLHSSVVTNHSNRGRTDQGPCRCGCGRREKQQEARAADSDTTPTGDAPLALEASVEVNETVDGSRPNSRIGRGSTA